MHKRKIVFVSWGMLDTIYILWYVFESYQRGSIPYYSDLFSTVDVLSVYGGTEAFLFTLFSWLLQISIIVSAVLLLTGYAKAKLVCYIQIPFRLMFIVPSVSVILVTVSFFDGYNTFLVLALIVISEILKAYTLWKYDKL